MIVLTGLDGTQYMIKVEWISITEPVPDGTLITFTNGQNHVVIESQDEVEALRKAGDEPL